MMHLCCKLWMLNGATLSMTLSKSTHTNTYSCLCQIADKVRHLLFEFVAAKGKRR